MRLASRELRGSGREAAAISFTCDLGKRDTMRMQPETRYTKAGEVKIAHQVLLKGVLGEWKPYAV